MPSPASRRRPTPARSHDPADDWRHTAACREVDVDLFFPLPGQSPRTALSYCEGCPVRAACLEDAIAMGVGGVRGGMTEGSRHQLARGRRQATAS